MKELEADIVVVGGGAAGLAAAVTAAESGARVIVLEKNSVTGGTGNMAMGLFAVESRIQLERQLEISRDQAFKMHMDFNHLRVDSRLVRAFIDKSASTIEWLESLGIEFSDVHCHNRGFNYTWHTVKTAANKTEPGAAALMLRVLMNRAKGLGAKLLIKMPANNITKRGDRITGVNAIDEHGEDIKIEAKAVIIATGGFGANKKWVKEYTGYELGRDVFVHKIRGLSGDGIRMAWEAGAAPTQMMIHLTCGIENIARYITLDFTFRQPNLVLNIKGERFSNEEYLQISPFFPNAIAQQKDRCAFIIFDEETKRYYQEAGLDFPPGIKAPKPFTRIDDFDSELSDAIRRNHRGIYVADSLEELSVKTGIDHDVMVDSINIYNEACEDGRDKIFNKNSKYLRPVTQPKYYAAKLSLGGYGTLGGIKINHKMEAVSENFNVIPGLYAAGSDANSIYSDTYIFTMPGNTLGFAINSGRIAGEEASKYIKNI